ncbi:MAG: hypothetical protein HYV02_02185 [Deltaproteobacteria bacterium]|nr:hypothetical protein [Deltaproteobacteria bacterium]
MIIRWLNTVLFGQRRPEISEKPIDSNKIGSHEARGLLDVIHEAIKSEAVELSQLLRVGRPSAQKRRRDERIRKKVKHAIDPQFDDDTLVEEITAKISDATDVDPYYQHLFNSHEKSDRA